ncbi:MAG: hypothetical protein Fur0041_04460 [Bacteroidia bacterium]
MKNILQTTAFLFTISAVLFSCKKDDDNVTTPPPPSNDHEIITSMILVFTDSSNGQAAGSFAFRDTDGDGANAPVEWDTISLQAGKTYFMKTILLNETTVPFDTISNEVLAEANDHQLFYSISGANMIHTYMDQDSNTPPLPVGLQNKIVTGAASQGTLRVILKHQPGTKNGQVTTGDTDIDILFQAKIQ